MKALAAGRRHWSAPLVLLLLALVAVGAAYVALTPRPATAAEAAVTAADIEAGKALFQANCATCHGASAEGREGIAPSLIGVGAAAVDFQVSTGRMPMSANAPQAEVKPPQLTEDQTQALAAYVASLGPGPAIPTDEQIDASLGDAAIGMDLFRTNCAMCHNAVGAGGALSEGKYAPPLSATDPVQIYEAMLTGPQSMPVFNDANLTPDEKRDIIAFLVGEREPAAGGLTLGSLGPVSEGMWAWLIGIGLLIGTATWLGAKSS